MNKCPACNKTTNTHFLYQNRDYLYLINNEYFNLMRCDECFLVSLDPQPPYDDLKKYYPDSYEPFTDKKALPLIKNILQLRSYFFSKKLQKIKGLDAHILEIGCANGENLLNLKSFGFKNLEGVEPSKNAAKLASERGLTVHYGSLESVIIKKKYDIIIMRHVFEHLSDPASALDKLSQLLREAGLVIIETPNYASLDRVITGKYWLGYDTPRHLYIYSPSNIRKLLKNSDFSIVDIRHSIVPNNWIESFKLYFNSTNRINTAKFFSIYNIFLLALFTPINILQALFSVSGRIKIILRKK